MNNPWAESDPDVPLPVRVRRYKLDRYLQGLRCVLWPSVVWDLTDPKERAQAVAFLEEVIEAAH